MTRKDTILIAVVINAGLLAILFMTAVIYDTDVGNEQSPFSSTLVDNKLFQQQPPTELIASALTGDEVDNVLHYYNPPTSLSTLNQKKVESNFPTSVESSEQENENLSASSTVLSSGQFIEVKVKRGDVLEKIAKANRTTVSAIKRANHLESERLTIGQILKIPPKPIDSVQIKNSIPGENEFKGETPLPVPSENEPVYYIVKSGDNPWKIAKQFGVKYEEILRLNHLDEEKARNLKIGDRVRVK